VPCHLLEPRVAIDRYRRAARITQLAVPGMQRAETWQRSG
jgi:hypothetical protein